MPVTVETAFQVSMDNSPVWKVATDRLRKIGDQWFAKFRSYDQSLVNLVLHEFFADNADSFQAPRRSSSRLSLAGLPGFKALLKLRNDCVLELESADAKTEAEVAAESLFDCSSKKRSATPRMNASRSKDIRGSPEVLEVSVPGFGEGPALAISMVKPAHPCDELCIKVDADTIEHCIVFIRNHGITVDRLTRRGYGSSECKGLWKNGSAGVV